jgi:tellurite resistance protein
MAISFSSSAYRRAPQAVIEACNAVAVVKNAAQADNYAAFEAKIIASAAMTGADVSFTEVTTDVGDGVGDRVNINGKTATRTGTAVGASDDLSIAYYNTGTSAVHYVLDAGDIDITTDNPSVIIPATIHWLRQPTLKV